MDDQRPDDVGPPGADSIRLQHIGRLTALARGLEREGAYNAAKLARAVLERELVRYAAAHAPTRTADLGDGVAALRSELAADGIQDVAAVLGPLEGAVRAGATIPLLLAPAVRTCRVCGELFLGDVPPATCPACEAPSLTFHEHLPVWYLEPAEPATVLAALTAFPSAIGAAIGGRDDASIARPPAPGAWSVREALEHIVFAEELLAERAARLLSEDDPDLAARAVWAETLVSDEGTVGTGEPASRLLDRYRASREATLGRLRGLGPDGWTRTGRHAEWGRVTVLSQAAYFARHEASHLAQLVAAADGRVPGRS